jgi:uncharacterized membrane-anchored protein
VIKENYIKDDKIVYFNQAETKLLNGKRINYTDFKHKEPSESDRLNHDRWIESYRNYHMDRIAIGRISYFIQNEKLNNIDIGAYQFIISGYYADFSYKFVIEVDGNANLYGTPLRWHKR